MTLLGMTGCMKKHIVSSPPAQRPGATVAATPAPKPKAAKEKPKIIEETYVVDGAADETPPAVIHESELADEAPAPTQTEATSEATVTSKAPTEKEAVKVPATTAEQTDSQPASSIKYYVQVGAFSDLENANKALATLLSDGYKGSRLSKTDNELFRVQAGAFPDETSAEKALLNLQKNPDYAGARIVKD